MPNVKIIATPAGEAPEAIREAWIGIVLPLREGLSGPVVHRTLGGVLTSPRNFFSQWYKLLFTKPATRQSYLVTAKVAIELLAQHNPEAAQWWIKNTPHYLTSTRWMLSFEPEVCELLP